MYQVNCPSGLSGYVRKLKGNEANILANREAAKQGITQDRILRDCWVETTSAGPYENLVQEGNSQLPWNKILTCDRFYTLVAIRVATYGGEFEFPARCPDDHMGCGESFNWVVNLESDLPLYDLPDESREKVSNDDNNFSTEFEGKIVHFRLQDGDGERRAAKLIKNNKDSQVTESIYSRIVEVEGMKKSEVRQWVQDCDFDKLLDLMSEFEKCDGGFETEFEIRCPHCGNEFDVEIPFNSRAFWIPSQKKTKKGKRKARTARTMQGNTED